MEMSEEEYIIEYKGLKIDPVIFTQGFVPGCDIGICSGECCDWGVYMDKDFRNIIMKFENEIKEVMEEGQIKDTNKWFEEDLENDTDFPSGFAIGTELYTTKAGKEQCIFKDSKGFCSIQVMATKHNMNKWAIKPKYCILYPLTVIDNVLSYDDDHSKRLNYCGLQHPNNFTQTVFEAMKEEIRYVFGDDCFQFLNDYYDRNYIKEEREIKKQVG
jgi:hypothetical protein